MNFYPLKDAQRIHPLLDRQNSQSGQNTQTLAKYGFRPQNSQSDSNGSDTSQFTDLLLSNRNVPMQSNMDFFAASLKPKEDVEWKPAGFDRKPGLEKAMSRDLSYKNEDRSLRNATNKKENIDSSRETNSTRNKPNNQPVASETQNNRPTERAHPDREYSDKKGRQDYSPKKQTPSRQVKSSNEADRKNVPDRQAESKAQGASEPDYRSYTEAKNQLNEPQNQYDQATAETIETATTNPHLMAGLVTQQPFNAGLAVNTEASFDDSQHIEVNQILLQATNSNLISEGKKILNLLSGQLSQLAPSEIPSLITENNFMSEALSSDDIMGFLNQKQPIQQLMANLGFSDQASQSLLQQLPEGNTLISPKDLLGKLGLDPDNVGIEVELMQKNIQLDGVTAYMQRATATISPESKNTPSEKNYMRQPLNQVLSKQLQINPEDANKATNDSRPLANLSAQTGTVLWEQNEPDSPVNIFDRLANDVEENLDPNRSFVAISQQMLGISNQPKITDNSSMLDRLPEESVLLDFSTLQENQQNQMTLIPGETTLINFDQSNLNQTNQINSIETNASSLTVAEDKPSSQEIPFAEIVTQDPMQQISREWVDNSTTLFTAEDLQGIAEEQSNSVTTDLHRLDKQEGQEQLIQSPHSFLNQSNFQKNQSKGDSMDATISDIKATEIAGVDGLESRLEADLHGDNEGGSDSSDTSGFENLATNVAQTKKSGSNVKGASFSERLQSADVKSTILDPIVNNAKMMLKEGGGSIRIDLGTQELGSIDLAIEIKENALELKIAAGSEMAKEILGAELPKLKEALLSQNLDLKSVEIGLKSEQQWSQSFGENGGGQQGFNREEFTEFTDNNGNTRVEKRTQYSSRSVSTDPGKLSNHQGQIQVRV